MTYVLSDIHGNQRRFDSIMKQINLQLEDTLFILGDVIDRYPDGIKILRKIMKMSNVKMLLGNHEYMMLNALGQSDDISDKNTDSYEKSLWYRNGGRVTHKYLKRIKKEYRTEVFQFIRQLPLNYDVDVGGVKYKLVHASPVENYTIKHASSYIYKSKTEFAVWDRWNEGMPVPKGYILVFGHTPTIHFQNVMPPCIWKSNRAIGIDCGSGYSLGRLACMRLDDMKEYYSEEQEPITDIYR